MSGLIGYIKTLDNKTKQNIYSLAISCIHKAIRMRMPEMAIAPTKIAWNTNQWRFKNRMLVCFTEDCCRDYEAMKWFSENYLEKVKIEEGAIEIVTKMCEAFKGKEGNFCKCCLLDWGENKIQISYNEEHLKRLIPEKYFEAYRIEVPVETMIAEYRKDGYEVPDWMENFLKMCYEMKLDRERQGVLIPIFYKLDGYETQKDVYDLMSSGADASFDKMFLYNGIDVHTYVGQIALNVAKKKNMLKFIVDNFDDVLWHLMMGNYRGVQKQKDGFCLTLNEKKLYVNEEIEKEWNKVIRDYNNLRRWAIDKFAPEYVLACKYALDIENFVEPIKEEKKEENVITQMEFDFGDMK